MMKVFIGIELYTVVIGIVMLSSIYEVLWIGIYMLIILLGTFELVIGLIMLVSFNVTGYASINRYFAVCYPLWLFYVVIFDYIRGFTGFLLSLITDYISSLDYIGFLISLIYLLLSIDYINSLGIMSLYLLFTYLSFLVILISIFVMDYFIYFFLFLYWSYLSIYSGLVLINGNIMSGNSSLVSLFTLSSCLIGGYDSIDSSIISGLGNLFMYYPLNLLSLNSIGIFGSIWFDISIVGLVIFGFLVIIGNVRLISNG